MHTRIAKILIFALLLLCVPLAHAVVIVDQDNLASDLGSNGGWSRSDNSFGRSQTFTVGVAGFLDSVEIDAITTPTSMRILATSAGVPIGGAAGSTVLATSASFSSVGSIFRFDFAPASLPVAIGDILAIEVFEGGGFMMGDWLASQSSYAGGSDFFFNTNVGIQNWQINAASDSAFRTYVNTEAVPISSTLMLLALGIAGFALSNARTMI